MIDAKQAYSLATSTKYDAYTVIKELTQIVDEIEYNAKTYGATAIKYKLEVIKMPKKRIFATYLEIIRELRKMKYHVSIQNEGFNIDIPDVPLSASWTKDDCCKGNSYFDTTITYLYISWDQRRKM